MAIGKPRLETLARLRRGLGGRDAHDVEADGFGARGKSRLEVRAAQKSRFS
jgi:hypothetical protein